MSSRSLGPIIFATRGFALSYVMRQGTPPGRPDLPEVPTYRAEVLERPAVRLLPDLGALAVEDLHEEGVGVRQDHHEPRAARPAISG